MSLITNVLINLVVFAALAFGGGLGTAWYMIEAGSRLSTRTLRPLDHLDRGRAAGRRPLHARAHGPQRAAAALLDAGAHLSGQGRQQRRPAALGLRVRHRHGGPRSRLVEPRRLRRPGQADPERGRALRLQQPHRHARARRPRGITLARDARPGNWLPIGARQDHAGAHRPGCGLGRSRARRRQAKAAAGHPETACR